MRGGLDQRITLGPLALSQIVRQDTMGLGGSKVSGSSGVGVTVVRVGRRGTRLSMEGCSQ